MKPGLRKLRLHGSSPSSASPRIPQQSSAPTSPVPRGSLGGEPIATAWSCGRNSISEGHHKHYARTTDSTIRSVSSKLIPDGLVAIKTATQRTVYVIDAKHRSARVMDPGDITGSASKYEAGLRVRDPAGVEKRIEHALMVTSAQPGSLFEPDEAGFLPPCGHYLTGVTHFNKSTPGCKACLIRMPEPVPARFGYGRENESPANPRHQTGDPVAKAAACDGLQVLRGPSGYRETKTTCGHRLPSPSGRDLRRRVLLAFVSRARFPPDL